ncbi:MAG TPA: redoxin domain-containing protein [Thermoanaerobaculia bacterium]|nr:redoxin domain-containing protein [Thermoanaerobaculia bacterium]
MRKRGLTAATLGGAILLALPGILGGLEVGAVAPDFGITTLEGRKFSLAEAAKTHKGVVILFISTICPYSNYYNDLIRDMAAEFGKRNVLFVGVNSGGLETAEEMRAHAREHGHTFEIVRDADSRIAEVLDARRTPEAFLLDSAGTLRYHGRIASKISNPDLKSAIEAFLDGRPIHPAETKAFGCAIPRK